MSGFRRLGRVGLSTVAVSVVLTGGLPTVARAALPPHDSVVSEVAASYTPHLQADSTISRPKAYALAQLGGTLYVGGDFRAVENAQRTESYPRDNIMGFDAATGDIATDFTPDFDGPVYAILGSGDSLYVGGPFSTVNGVSRPAIAKINARTGALDPTFRPPMISGGRVSEIRLVNGRLLVGGSFPKRLVALDPATGANTNYINTSISGKLPLSTSKTEVYRFAVNPAGTRLVGVGNFTSVDGQNRQRAFMLTLGGAQASLNPWYYPPLDKKCLSNSPTRQAYLDDVDFSPDGSYFVFASTGYVPTTTKEIGTALCDAAARFETDVLTPRQPTWINYTGGDTLHSVAVTDAAVYVQGHNRWLDNPYGKNSAGPGAVVRKGIGAIDPVTGKALAWNPPKPAAQGGQDFLVTAGGLWIGSDSINFNGDYHRGIAFAPLP